MTAAMPPLPEPVYVIRGVGYSPEQMLAYAAACVAAERDACAKVCEATPVLRDGVHPYSALITQDRLIEAIRARAALPDAAK